MHNISSTLSLMFRRGASFLYDCLLLTATFFLITAIAVALNDGNAIQHPGYYLLLYCIGFVFFDWFWRHGGQTLGMRAWRIRVVGMNSDKMTFKQSLARYLSGSLLFGITLLYMPFSARGLALHDQLSGTKIVLHYR